MYLGLIIHSCICVQANVLLSKVCMLVKEMINFNFFDVLNVLLFNEEARSPFVRKQKTIIHPAEEHLRRIVRGRASLFDWSRPSSLARTLSPRVLESQVDAKKDGHLRIWEWPSLRIIIDEPRAHKSFRDMDFSLDSEFLASTCVDGSARIWSMEDGVPLTSLVRNPDENFELCRLSKDGTKPFLFCVVKKKLCSWDPLKRPTADQSLQHPFFHVGTRVSFPVQDPLELRLNNIGAKPNLELNLWDFGADTDDCFLGLTLAVKPSISNLEAVCNVSQGMRKDILFCSDFKDHQEQSGTFFSECERDIVWSIPFVDFKNDYKTMELKFMESVWWVFSHLFDKGLVYKGFKDVPDPEIIVAFPIVDDPHGVAFVAWTTTPWMLPSNLCLCVNANFDYMKVCSKYTGKVIVVDESRLSAIPVEKPDSTVANGSASDSKASKSKGRKNENLMDSYQVLEKVKGSELVQKK
ncbi:hypothetical protein K2173_023287 [Erythroxylum novogranatense]|uniref:Aminoacyl-tRNA synthetase class Ia domain-containing protein n=1 Tax=Erythroxylum novogranatense TaxID=1862640 RepID=A0AAV8T8V3_9ROSI|nr:hypothetical protein K2173_023287 [Erythroxylum novogranatense]